MKSATAVQLSLVGNCSVGGGGGGDGKRSACVGIAISCLDACIGNRCLLFEQKEFLNRIFGQRFEVFWSRV